MQRSLAIAVLAGLWGAQTLAASAQSPADRLRAAETISPPWQHGDGSDVAERGLEFTVLPVDVLADFHGSLDNPQLVLFASGNYFLALGRAVEVFGRAHPRYRGHIFYETLPPGLLLKQMEAGGTVTSGNMTWTVKPDVYLAERAASEDLVQQGRLTAPVVTFATNDLASWCVPATRRMWPASPTSPAPATRAQARKSSWTLQIA